MLGEADGVGCRQSKSKKGEVCGCPEPRLLLPGTKAFLRLTEGNPKARNALQQETRRPEKRYSRKPANVSKIASPATFAIMKTLMKWPACEVGQRM